MSCSCSTSVFTLKLDSRPATIRRWLVTLRAVNLALAAGTALFIHEWARPDLRRRGRRTLWNAEFSRGDPCLTVIRAGWRDRTRRRPPLWAPRSRRSRSSPDPSALDLVAQIFQRFADLPPPFAESFLDLARG